MAPLSIVPGRIRLDVPQLVGRAEECQRLERRLAALEGVREAGANVRTGRVLIRFDAELERGEPLLRQFAEVLASAQLPDTGPAAAPSGARCKAAADQGGFSSKIARHLLLDALSHMLLPGPLQMLVPAVSALRR